MSEYVEIIEGEEFRPQQRPHKPSTPESRYKNRSISQKEADHAKRASFDLLEIKDMYIRGHPLQWISENTQACTITFKPVAVGRITELVGMYRWAPQKAAYKLGRDEAEKEWPDKLAKACAEAYKQGQIAGKAEQTALYERTFTEKMTDEAEKKAKELMDQGKVKEAMDVTYQIERLRRMKSPPVKLKPVTKNDSEPDEADCDDMTMQLLDQAVAETEKVAGGR